MTAPARWPRRIALICALALVTGACTQSRIDSNVDAAKSGLDKADAYLQDLFGVTPDHSAAKSAPRSVSRNGGDEAERQYATAMRYLTGRGVPVDNDRAARHLTLAADLGHADAQYTLGALYAVTPRDEAEKKLAVQWFEAAARQGHARAQYRLGEFYLNGFGVDTDAARAAEWYRKAARAGNHDAEFMLAQLHLLGKGVEPDRHAALKLFADAARHGHPEAKRYHDALELQIRELAAR